MRRGGNAGHACQPAGGGRSGRVRERAFGGRCAHFHRLLSQEEDPLANHQRQVEDQGPIKRPGKNNIWTA